MTYIANTIIEQWTCLDPAEMFLAWEFALNVSLELTCYDRVGALGVFVMYYGDAGIWRHELWESQWNVHYHIGDECEGRPVYYLFSEIDWLPELAAPLAEDKIHATIDVRCRQARGFP